MRTKASKKKGTVKMKITVKNAIFVIIGSIILAFGTSAFILPHDLVVGGVSGIALVLMHVLPFDFLTVDILVVIISWLLFLVGFIFLGKSFAIKTLLSTVVYTIGVSGFTRLLSLPAFYDFIMISEHPELTLLLSAVFGGALIGVGCAITFRAGGSTGGVDIISLIICKYFHGAKNSVVIFVVDASIVLLGAFVIQKASLMLLGVLSAFVSAIVIERVMLLGNGALIAEIITSAPDEITSAVIEELDRTSTIMSIVGGYSKKQGQMLKISFEIRQYRELMNIVKRYDPKAFIIVYKAHEIKGEGWES